jgi:Zn-dependent protease with chaperone function
MLATGYRVFELVFLTSSTPILIRLSGLPSLAAIGYFPAGILYQTISYFSNQRDMISGSEPADLGLYTTHQIRVFSFNKEESVYFAAGINTGLNQYILVSDDLLDDFNEKELKAVISHEEAHISYGDTTKALIVVFVSFFTGLGRNLFYAQLNFHDREFKADESAARKTGPGVVISALRKFQENNLPRSDRVTGLGISPFGGIMRRPEGPDKYFDLFFGDYTIREAHPSVEERVKRLRELD